MLKFCFVILHYKTAKDTIECIDSIEKIEEQYDIVIVDNASNNGSIEEVENYVDGKSNIYIIKNTKNLGFADGNNVGYKFAKKDLQTDFIAISNNDIIVESANIIQYCNELYEKKQFYILGPDIESMVDHGHQNPMTIGKVSLKQIKKEIFRYRILYILSKIGIYDVIRKNKNKISKKERRETFLELVENVQLHGSFMIFSPTFVQKEEIAFRTGTFLYMEEAILFQYCRKKGYKTIFSPDIKVFHKEDSSTNFIFKATKEKREFIFKNMINSLKVYYHIINDQ